MDENKRKKVLSPVVGKDNKTYWVRMGTGFVNHDNSINVYLDGLPTNGKLQIRDWEDSPWEKKPQQQFAGLAAVPAASGAGEDLPF